MFVVSHKFIVVAWTTFIKALKVAKAVISVHAVYNRMQCR